MEAHVGCDGDGEGGGYHFRLAGVVDAEEDEEGREDGGGSAQAG